jgi:hypothetical protein
MAKKITLETLAEQMAKGFATQGKEIRDLTEGVGFVVKHMATKDQVIELHTQVNSIETQLRDMKHVKLQSRVADLEEKVFGATRS